VTRASVVVRPIRQASGRTRAVVAVVAAIPVLIVLAVVGLRHTLPPTEPRVLSGAIWLSSRAMGQLTLIDAIAAGVAANVVVAVPGTDFTALQQGRFGYAVETGSGRVAVVDGATLGTSAATPMAGSPGGIVAYATEGALYVFNTHSRLVQAAEPRTLGQLGRPATVAGTDRTTASDGQRVWALEPGTGDILRLGAAARTVREDLRRSVTRSTNDVSLHIAAGLPVVMDRATGLANLLEPETAKTGQVLLTNAKAGDLVTGSPTEARLLIAEPSRSVLTACSFATGVCDLSVPVGRAGDELGPAVEVDNRAYVPNYTASTVSIVDLSSGAVARTPPLFNRHVSYELVARDGLVLFNDPDSEHAGVVASNGSVRRIKKYEPPKPKPTVTQSKNNPKSEPTPGKERTPTPSPVGTHPTDPDPSSSPSPGGGLQIQRLLISPRTPEAGEEVRFAADVTGMPDTWSWSVTPEAGGAPEATSDKAEFGRAFATPGTYRVTLAAKSGPDRHELSTEFTVIPPAPRVRCGDQISVSVVLRENLDCGDLDPALRVIDDDVIIDLNGHTLTTTKVAVQMRGFAADTLENVTIRNGTIVGSLEYERAPAAHIEEVNLQGSAHIWDSTGMEIRSSEIRHSQWFALDFQGSENAVLADTTVTGDVQFESSAFPTVNNSTFNGWFRLEELAGAQLTRNKFVDARISIMEHNDARLVRNEFTRTNIRYYGDSLGTIYQDNVFQGADVAIDFYGSISQAGSRIERNRFEGNRIGIWVRGPLTVSSNLSILRNTFTGNHEAGLLVTTPTPEAEGPVTIANNTFTRNGRSASGAVNDGLHVDIASGDPVIVIRDNTTQSNGDCGIEIRSGAIIDGHGNVSRGDPRGCVGIECG
jgi:hypothetical protein